MKNERKTIMETCYYDTYPNAFIDYENMIENENYDYETKYFKVPLTWAENYIRKEYGCSKDDFDCSYDYDDTFEMYTQAIKEKVIISAWVESR